MNSAGSGMERRVHTRFSTNVPVGLRFPVGPHRDGWGRIIDISAGGLQIETRFAATVGGVLYATFALQDGSRFDNLRARIVRAATSDGYHMLGVAFDEVVDHETMRDVLSGLSAEGKIVPQPT